MRRIILSTSDASGGVVYSATGPADIHGLPGYSLQAVVTGTVNYTVQQTLDDPFDPDVTPTWFDHPDSNLVAATASKLGNYSYPATTFRLKQNSGTGSVRLTIIQSGIDG